MGVCYTILRVRVSDPKQLILPSGWSIYSCKVDLNYSLRRLTFSPSPAQPSLSATR